MFEPDAVDKSTVNTLKEIFHKLWEHLDQQLQRKHYKTLIQVRQLRMNFREVIVRPKRNTQGHKYSTLDFTLEIGRYSCPWIRQMILNMELTNKIKVCNHNSSPTIHGSNRVCLYFYDRHSTRRPVVENWNYETSDILTQFVVTMAKIGILITNILICIEKI